MDAQCPYSAMHAPLSSKRRACFSCGLHNWRLALWLRRRGSDHDRGSRASKGEKWWAWWGARGLAKGTRTDLEARVAGKEVDSSVGVSSS